MTARLPLYPAKIEPQPCTNKSQNDSEVLEKELKVMQFGPAFTLRDYKLPILCFNMNKPGVLRRVVMGERRHFTNGRFPGDG